MNRVLFGIALLLVSAAPAAYAQAGSAPTSLPAFDESHFLKAAEDAAKTGDHEGAVQLYQSAIIYAPTDPIPYERLAELYATAGQAELAQQYFILALDAEPAHPRALQGLAMLQLAAGNRAGAQAQHEILLRACGASCPETAEVEKALKAAPTP